MQQPLKMCHLSFTNSTLFPPWLPTTLSFSPKPIIPLTIRMGGGPRTFPGGVSKWQWKRMQAKKSAQLLKARLARERQIYDMRKRAELKAAVAKLERPWEPVSDDESGAVNLFSVSADEQVKVLADRFHKPGGFDLWTERDGPQLFRTDLGTGFLPGSENDETRLRKAEVGDGRETSRFINGRRGKGRVNFNGRSEERLESPDNFNNGNGQRVGSRDHFNSGNNRRVEGRVNNGGSGRRVEGRFNNGGSGRRVESRVNFNGENERRFEGRVNNSGNERRVESRVGNGGSRERVRSRVNFGVGNEQRSGSRVSQGVNGRRVGNRVKFNVRNERRVESRVRNGGSRFDKIGAYKRTDWSESEAYDMSLERDGSYGYQAKSGEGETSS